MTQNVNEKHESYCVNMKVTAPCLQKLSVEAQVIYIWDMSNED